MTPPDGLFFAPVIVSLGEKPIMTSNRLQESIRAVAIFEAVKGALALVVGLGLLGLLHKDTHRLACEFISLVHLSSAQKYSKLFIDLAGNITDNKLWLFSGLALVYSAFRFVEGYGLWKERVWGEWLAVVSGMIYLPIEVYEVCVKISFVSVFALVANILVVGVVAYVLIQKKQPRDKSS
jgi:uncharacterized membrane protein (DUF2068 family)